MHTASRFEFDPPAARQGLLRAYGLALLVHGLLAAALTWGVSWRSSDTRVSVEAELWSAVPQEVAPKLVEPEPTPEPAPPPPPPPPKAETPRQSEADIALAREKERQAKEKLEQQRLEREKLAREKEREQQAREKKLAEEKRKKELEAKQAKLQEQKEAEQREKLRQENLQRMTGLANATGKPTATGTATQASGVSSSYAGRIRARVKPNIVFSEELATNPTAEVEVRTSPDGTIVGRRLLKSSGHKSWDDAVLKAIDKTETLPRNEDGVVPSPLVISFRPRD